ncbi:MAG: SDR family NAD(P)-dependent oxidoreductase [Streptosporangiaceae bacterium]|jgi:dTDP-L-rhamnose 4-epimerase
MSSRILVTGGAGFIGSHIVDQLLARGYDVRVYDSLVPQVHGTAGARNLAADAELVVGDVRNRSALKQALRGADAVIHLAAEVGVGQSMYEIDRYVDTNTRGTAVLLQLLAEGGTDVSRLIVASSMSIYGEGAYRCDEHGTLSPRPRSDAALLARQWEARCPVCDAEVRPVPTAENKPLIPTSVYAVSKMDQEMLSLTVGGAYGIGAVALRIFNTYGPRQSLSNPYTGIGAIFSARLLNDRPPLVFEDGQQLRDFVHVSDVARAFVTALEKTEVTGVACNVGTGSPLSVTDIARYLAVALGKNVPPEITGDFRAGDIRHCWADTAAARRDLGFRAEVSFADGVNDLVGWLAEHTADDRVDEARAELLAHGLTG